ncbi:hypothetical protein F2Q68_00018875 [Brassica cretica]|uniref:SURP motif domain-containing protein n=1 Tax=Brassica cretica TaxID=69181 RepID=A0A8S9FPB3_BRACR|nr:hypothetical protein F2Q68_00018875 [Brassica cretica]
MMIFQKEEDETARMYQEFVDATKTFVRGGTINPSYKPKVDSEGVKSKDGGSISKKGSRYVPSFLPPPLASKGKEPETKREKDRPKEREKGKTRTIDHFMEELKREQGMRERRNQDRDRQGDNSPSSRFDELPDEFDPTGKLGSFDDGDPQTKSLYGWESVPKETDEEKRRQRNCGFVSFMHRPDGQAAKDEMQGIIMYEYELKIGWGKAVSLPSQALPAPPPGHMAIRRLQLDFFWSIGSTNNCSNSKFGIGYPVVTPEDEHLRHVIDTLALYVLDGECAFEQAIMERGRGNPLFNFLFELGSKEHTYYVWRLYSFAQEYFGDTLQRWRTEPYIMITGSGRWIPPPLPRAEVERTLTDPQRDEFEDMLRALTLERSQIKEAMGFALDNVDAAGEVLFDLNYIDAALVIGKGAARQELMDLPICELERRCRHNRLSLVGGRVVMVARLLSLEDTEKQRGYEAVDEISKYQQDHSTWEEVKNEREVIRNSYAEVQMKDPMAISIPQPELKAVVEKEKNDLILTASKWARDDDEADDVQKKSYSPGGDNTGGITFKVDNEDLKGNDCVRAQPDNGLDEEQRQKLRRIEVALIEYREALEEQEMKNTEEIERKVEIKRKKVEVDHGLSGSHDGNRNLLLTAEQSIVERKERPEDSQESSKMWETHSQSPPRKSSTRERDHDLDRSRVGDRERQHDLNRGRDRREKSSTYERGRSSERDRDWRRRDLR